MDSKKTLLQTLGSRERALDIARRAAKNVPAYSRLLAASGIDEVSSFEALPLTDKGNYLGPSPYRDLLADDYDRTFTIFKSSGSSGQAFYWPQLKEQGLSSGPRLCKFLEDVFHIHERRTLAIVGLALGSWIGGEHLSWALKSIASATPYPFSVFSPGSAHDEIIAMIVNADPFVDQFLVFLCPSAISHMHLKAQDRGIALPHGKLRYMVLGEPFPENLRLSLQKAAGAPPAEPVILSMYGSADTGFLGVESPASAVLRQAVMAAPDFAGHIGLRGALPHFFHFSAPDAYVEVVDGELCVTRWQGIPLVRYNLHDSATILSWQSMCSIASELAGRNPALAALAGAMRSVPDLPDLISIHGRSDGCLILCGTNISETMLDEAVRAASLSEWLTGAYKARIAYEDNRQHLEFDLEWKKDAPMDTQATNQVYAGLVRELGCVQPEFLDDWRNVYSAWDDNPAKRILRLKPVRWPELSGKLEKVVKHRGTRS